MNAKPCHGLLAGIAMMAATVSAAPPQLLTGADLHTVSHGVIAGGDLLLVDGRIAAMGVGLDAPGDAVRIDLRGKRIYPGLIAANSVIGLTEVAAVRPTNDFAEAGAINPNVRAELAVNPDTELWPVTRANGVLAALVVPQVADGGIIAGQSALMKPDGWTIEEMTIADQVGIHVHWPSTRVPAWQSANAERIRESAQRRREALDAAFRDARAYAAFRGGDAGTAPDLRWDALRPVLERRKPLFVHADDIVQIRDALAFAKRERLRIVLVGGADAWRLVPDLKAQDVAVILGSAHDLPLRRSEPYDAVYASAGKLAAAGVRFAIANDGDTMSATNERNLPYQAASYVAYGLDAARALQAITLEPARILGVDDRLGSLDVGKSATLFVANGDILDIRSYVERAWIDGREIDLANRQARLDEKYRSRYAGQPKR